MITITGTCNISVGNLLDGKLIMREAIKKTIRGSKKYAKKATKERYTYRPSPSKAMKTKTRGVVGELIVADRRHGVDKFKLKRNAKGTAHVEVVRGQGGDIPSTFYIGEKTVRTKMQGDYRGFGGLYVRTTPSRYPIKKLLSVSVSQQAGHPIPARYINEMINEKLASEVESALARYG